MTLKGISEASALRYTDEEVACPAMVDGEQMAFLSSDLLAAAGGCWQGQGPQLVALCGAGQ